ncbi:cbb3-type cytochrome c oxidase subunit II [Methylacidimicrobium sp. B4]|uniref:cbb3-type cytochrome c oxidase subunit II n=1 Tax=Methylacidimicrobium sp. B4 TaxID=2796139 RepID=UPI001A8DC0D6|nr:cbb3-type cytochrome c oxidase subunit II [Methylacidimicrobium sp. B4]QSR85581.1 cbb3-type cytochrome c oxidase subunit II [Methylacidimicrobium sp. B4]
MPDRLPTSAVSVPAAAAAVVAIAATYVDFLLFAQFGFLGLIQAQGVGGSGLRGVLLAMGCGGVAGSLAAARLFRRSRLRKLLLVSFVVSGAAALLSTMARSAASFAFLAAGIGGSVGILTVTLSASVAVLLDPRRRGFQIGLGTGIAYAVCNVPTLFAGSAWIQAAAAAGACGLGAVATRFLKEPEDPPALPPHARPASGFRAIVVVFLVLVWVDSACFSILEATPNLNRFAWGEPRLQWRNGLVHFLAACAGGWYLDRGGLRGVLALSFLLLAGSAAMVGGAGMGARAAGWLYPAGVSLYSAALVFAPGCLSNRTTLGAAAWRAAILYAVAGWCGSAMGIGMAQDLHAIPGAFLAASLGVVGVCLLFPRVASLATAPRSVPYWAGLGAIGLLSSQLPEEPLLPSRRSSSPEGGRELGREVYIREGCIHCHSQYIRPGSRDEEWWGPAQPPLDRKEEIPPLIGNRRQGPDLLRVGNRRSPEWNRLHLIDPRSLVPESRMPSYAHLFADGNPCGEALIAYLEELGASTREDRAAAAIRWLPAPESRPADPATGAKLFAESCAQCHGVSGHGDGPLAKLVGSPPPSDLTRSSWGAGTTEEAAGRLIVLARIIKFGIPGTTMAGHETLEDSKILGLAAYVARLSTQGSEPMRAP